MKPMQRRILALASVLLVTLVLADSASAKPEQCHTRLRLAGGVRPCDITLWPMNLSAGYGALVESGDSKGAFFVGLQVVTLTWRHLFVNVGEIHLILSTICHDGPTNGDNRCGIVGDFFVGSRPGVVWRLGHRGRHHLVLNTGLGWGTVGSDWNGRPGTASGLVISPAVRYAYLGVFGAEVQAFLPAYSGLGERYPAAITFNLVGFPMAVLALLGH